MAGGGGWRESERCAIMEEMLFTRENYDHRIDSENTGSTVRLLTGIRRSGKSSLIRQAMEKLRARGVDDRHIIYYDLENYVLPEIHNNRELRQRIEKLLKQDGKFYLFLDEIQAIPGWEKTLSAFQTKTSIEFFIASSGNSLKNFRGKKYFNKNWTEINIKPASYSEYRNTNRGIGGTGKPLGLLRRAMVLKNMNRETFNKYIAYGGFPGVLNSDENEKAVELNNIFTSILFHDVIIRQKIKDSELLQKIIKYIFEHIGGESSAGQLATYFRKERYTKNLGSIRIYLKALEEACIIKRVRLLNLTNYKPLNMNSRYYAGDHALVYAVSGSGNPRLYGILENILVNELERRGYEIYRGKYGKAVIEFVAAKEKKALFIQTTDITKDDDKTIRDKLTALINVPSPPDDIFKLKFFIFFDAAPELESGEGEIKRLSLPDFLLRKDY
jgi:predicted AAA+ superfamily ATPase